MLHVRADRGLPPAWLLHACFAISCPWPKVEGPACPVVGLKESGYIASWEGRALAS